MVAEVSVMQFPFCLVLTVAIESIHCKQVEWAAPNLLAKTGADHYCETTLDGDFLAVGASRFTQLFLALVDDFVAELHATAQLVPLRVQSLYLRPFAFILALFGLVCSFQAAVFGFGFEQCATVALALLSHFSALQGVEHLLGSVETDGGALEVFRHAVVPEVLLGRFIQQIAGEIALSHGAVVFAVVVLAAVLQVVELPAEDGLLVKGVVHLHFGSERVLTVLAQHGGMLVELALCLGCSLFCFAQSLCSLMKSVFGGGVGGHDFFPILIGAGLLLSRSRVLCLTRASLETQADGTALLSLIF